MADDSEFLRLADQAQRLGEQVSDRRLSGSWRAMAAGFRRLAWLRRDAYLRWQSRRQPADKEKAGIRVQTHNQ